MEMMTGRTLFRNYKEYDQKEVEICGWVKSNRGSKKFGFLVINDGTFFEPIQVVYDQEMGNFDTVSKLNVGTAVIVNGTVIVTPDAKQPFEIQAEKVEVFSDLFGRLLFQLYYTVCNWRTANAALLHEPR